MRWRRFLTPGLVLAIVLTALPAGPVRAHSAADATPAHGGGAVAQPVLSVHPAAARQTAAWTLTFRTTRPLAAADTLLLHLPAGTDATDAAVRINGHPATVTGRAPLAATLPEAVHNGTQVTVAVSGLKNPAAGLYSVCLETEQHHQATCTGAVAILPADVPGLSHAAGSIAVLYLGGTVHGYEDGTFRPDEPMARAEFARLLAVSLRLRLPHGVAPPVFHDVTADDWYYEAVTAVAAAGLMQGTGHRFQPAADLKRETLALALYRVLTATADADWKQRLLAANRWPEAVDRYDDAGQVSPAARQAMGLALGLGLLAPTASGRLEPAAPVTRAEVAQALYKTLLELAQAHLVAGADAERYITGPAAAGCPLPGADGDTVPWLAGLRDRLSPVHTSLADLVGHVAHRDTASGHDEPSDPGFWPELKAKKAAVALDVVYVTAYLLACPAPEQNRAEAAGLLRALAALWLDLDHLAEAPPHRALKERWEPGELVERLRSAAGDVGAAIGWVWPDYSWWQDWSAAGQLEALGDDLKALLADLVRGNWLRLDADAARVRVRLEVLLLQVEMGGPVPKRYADVAADLRDLARDIRRALEACGRLGGQQNAALEPVAAARYTLRALFALSRLTTDLTLLHVEEHLTGRD